ncbi:hypothetical protein NM208_g1929 [Fusarium decemcellulare]|uniref:Uncharacterized protein n=1 Tax=Fusarium decemcellulare TaxID=57161 RepID=A0ACC1SUD3_9HYPO|nr:hypothetical protein NM208_g1929 [Fusarium decemcellulare]
MISSRFLTGAIVLLAASVANAGKCRPSSTLSSTVVPVSTSTTAEASTSESAITSLESETETGTTAGETSTDVTTTSAVSIDTTSSGTTSSIETTTSEASTTDLPTTITTTTAETTSDTTTSAATTTTSVVIDDPTPDCVDANDCLFAPLAPIFKSARATPNAALVQPVKVESASTQLDAAEQKAVSPIWIFVSYLAFASASTVYVAWEALRLSLSVRHPRTVGISDAATSCRESYVRVLLAGAPPEGQAAASYAQCTLLLLATCLSSAFVILSTSKSGLTSLARYAWLVVVVFNGKQFLQQVSATGSSMVINGIIMGEVTLVFLQCCNFLVVTRLDTDALIRARIFQVPDGLFTKAFRTTCLMFNLRGIRTPWQIKRLNRFPRFYDRHGDSGKPHRSSYIIRQLLIISWQYLFLDVVYISSLDTTPEDTEKLFGQGMEFVYFNATIEQWAGRVAVGLFAWLVPARINLDIGYRIISVVSVFLGATSPEDWPPLFGNVWDIYTIRGFWSIFWHQYCRWALTSISNFICRDVLRVPRPSLVERYLNIAVVFVASGIFHVIVDSFSFHPPPKAPTLAFFASFSLAIMIEDSVQELCRRVTGVNTQNGKQTIPLWHKLVGYLWVSVWLTVTSPWYLYHPTRLPTETKWLVPVSLVQFIGPSVAHFMLTGGGLVLMFTVGIEI